MPTPNKSMQTDTSPNEKPVALGNFTIGSMTELLDDLLQLTQLLNQGKTDQYWQRCAEILLSYQDVDAVSIWLFSSHESVPEVSVRVGDFRDSRLRRIERWEDALQNAPMSMWRPAQDAKVQEFKPLEAGRIELGIGRRHEDMPILHMRLQIDGLLHGGVSLALSNTWAELHHDYQDLTRFVQLVTDNGLRHHQLSITRHRLDQMSLIAQVS